MSAGRGSTLLLKHICGYQKKISYKLLESRPGSQNVATPIKIYGFRGV